MMDQPSLTLLIPYLVVTAALGPYMVTVVMPDIETSGAARQEQMSALQLMASSGFEKDLVPMTADQIARANSSVLLALNAALNAEAPLDAIKGGPHAHGNLEALLNIAAGIVLGLLAVAPLFKQLISWLFLLGALLHSGSLYLVIVFQAAWALPILASGIGPILLLAALLLMGIAAAIGYRGRLAEG
jgi:hypothetical protein